MNKSLILLPGILISAMFTGCQVDQTYDLEKLDTEISMFKESEFPVPDAKPFTLQDIFDPEQFDYITCNNLGDYIFSFQMDPVEVSVYVPEVVEDNRIPVEFEPELYVFQEVPDILSGEGSGIVPDLSDLAINLLVSSGIPADFSVSTTIETLKSGAVEHQHHIDNLSIPSGSSLYVLKEDPSDPATGIRIPGLGEWFYPVPDAFRISELEVFADPSQRDKVQSEEAYSLSFLASVESPLCLATGSLFKHSIPVEASLNLSEIGLKRAQLIFDYENTIPLDLKLSAYALDADGNRLDSVKAVCDLLNGNTSGNSMIEMTTQGDLRFSSMVIDLEGVTSNSVTSIPFNRNQGIRLFNMKLYLPDGIQVKIDNNQ